MNQRDVDRLCDGGRASLDVTQMAMVAALETAHKWTGPLKASSFDPSGRSWRYEEIAEDGETIVVAVPHDSTGEAAIGPAPDRNRHRELLRAAKMADVWLDRLHRLVAATAPVTAQRYVDDDDPGEGWCWSCWRIGTLSPVAQHSNGTAKYKDLCSWCGAFKADHECLPPEVLLKKRRDGKRIYQVDIDRALGRAS